MFVYTLVILLGSIIAAYGQGQIIGGTGQCTVVNNYFREGDSPPPISSLVGPPGKRGPVGLKGEKGSQGIVGPQGAPGDPIGPLPRTCSGISGRRSGYYWIAPSPDTVQPLYVYCDFSGSIAKTKIGHNALNEIQVTKCVDAGCYNMVIKYSGTMEQIVAVIDASTTCRQFIKYRCDGSVLLYYPNPPYGWWVSRTGDKMQYWGGARRDQYCACGETGTCHDKTKRCNCDWNSGAKTLTDEGYLTDKQVLPVTKLYFGDTDGAGERGWHTLGHLECW